MRPSSTTRQRFVIDKLQVAGCDVAKRCCFYSTTVGNLDGDGRPISESKRVMGVEREDGVGDGGADSVALTSAVLDSSPSTSDVPTLDVKDWKALASQKCQYINTNQYSEGWNKLSQPRPNFAPFHRWNPIVSAFKSMVKISQAKRREERLDPLVLSLTWEECSKLAIRKAGTLTSFEIAHIANCCKNGLYTNLELLGALVERGREPVVLHSFDPIQISITVLAFGELARRARDCRDEAAISFFGSTGQDFIRDLLRVALDTDQFSSVSFGHVGLSSLMKGVGMLFLKDGGELVERCIDVVAKEFTRKIVFYECSSQSYSNFLYGCVLLGHSDPEVLHNVGQSIIHSIITFQDFNAVSGSIIFGLGGLDWRHTALIEMLGWKLVDNLNEVQSRELVRAALGFRSLEYDNEQILVPLCAEVVTEARLKSFSAGALASLINSLGYLRRDVETIITPLVVELLTPHRLAEMEVRLWSLVMYGLGVSGFKNFPLLDALGRCCSRPEALQEMPDSTLLGVLYNLWTLGCPNEMVTGPIEDEVSRRLSSFSEADVSRVVTGGLSCMGDKDSRSFRSMCKAVVSSRQMWEWSEEGLANLVHGFTCLEITDPELWVALVEEVVKDCRAGKYEPEHLATIFQGFSKLDFLPAQIMEGLIEEVTSRWEEFSARQAAHIVRGLGQWEAGLLGLHGPTLELMELVASKMKEQGWDAISIVESEHMVWGLGRLRFLDKDLLCALIEHSIAIFQEDNGSNAKAFVNILKACASLNHRDPKLLAFVREHRMAEKLDRFEHVATMLWALALLDDLSLAEFTDLCGLIESWEGVENSTTEVPWRQIVQSWFHVHILGKQKGCPDHPSMVSSTVTEPPIVTHAKERCKASQLMQPSQFEVRVKEQLGEAGISSESGVVLCGGLINVDLMIEGNPPIVIECDGPWHYTSNKVDGVYMPQGETIFRNRVLEALGYKVVCLPFYKDEIEQIDLIWEALNLNCHESKGGAKCSSKRQVLRCAA